MDAKGEQYDPSLQIPTALVVKALAVAEACPPACSASSGISGASRTPEALLTLQSTFSGLGTPIQNPRFVDTNLFVSGINCYAHS